MFLSDTIFFYFLIFIVLYYLCKILTMCVSLSQSLQNLKAKGFLLGSDIMKRIISLCSQRWDQPNDTACWWEESADKQGKKYICSPQGDIWPSPK